MLPQDDTAAGPDPWVFAEGRLQRRSRARVPIRDVAFLYGEGVFETLRARGDRAFRAVAHLRRLRASARAIGWSIPWDDDELGDSMRRTLEANGFAESRLRLQASPGCGGLDGADGPPLLVVDVAPFDPVPEQHRRDGVRVVLAEGAVAAGGPAGGSKTAAYLERVLARRAARRGGAFEVLRRDALGAIPGASMANLFLVRGRELRTPEVAGTNLAGITRQVVLELVRSAGRPAAREGSVAEEDLRSADELFLTSTGIEVLPVVQAGAWVIGAGVPGPVTRWVERAYRARLEEEIGALAG